jgi:hypothetical protein
LGEGAVWFCCWLVELWKKYFFTNSNFLCMGCVFLVDLLNLLILPKNLNLGRRGGVILLLTCWIEKKQIFFHKLKFFVYGVFFPRWLVELADSAYNFWIGGVSFLCWLVELGYRVLKVRVCGRWIRRWLVELSKNMFSATKKKLYIGFFSLLTCW